MVVCAGSWGVRLRWAPAPYRAICFTSVAAPPPDPSSIEEEGHVQSHRAVNVDWS
jgi:hypothetical protein